MNGLTGITRIHITGCAGVGMSALAELLCRQGYNVTGSDRYHDERQAVPALAILKAMGVEMVPQDGRGSKRADLVVVSSAIEDDNPDLLAARQWNVPVAHRAQVLAWAVQEQRVLAVAGTSGKTTVTAMIGWMLEQLGADPTVINGGMLPAWRQSDALGCVRLGQSNLCVLEADESDRSFLNFAPEWAVITNISHDHFELDETRQLFRVFGERVGLTILCGSGVREACADEEGLLPGEAQWMEPPCRITSNDDGYAVELEGQSFPVSVMGRHNAENAALAIAACRVLGFDFEEIRDALASFHGVHRRLEIVGQGPRGTVLDDYAHNPAKIRAAWSAVAERYPAVQGVWRPHGYGPLAAMADDLADVFADTLRPADRLYILPVYFAGGTATRTLEANAFVARLQEAGLSVEYVADYDAAVVAMNSAADPAGAVLVLGARDPDLPNLARRLAECPIQ